MTDAQTGEPQERLVVKDAENLHPMGQFFQSMLLNLLREPRKVRMAEKLDLAVAIEPTDYPDNALTMTFSKGRVILEGQTVPKPDVKIKCELNTLLKLARVPAGPAVIKFLRTSEGKDLVRKVLSGKLKIKGIVRHPLGLMKFAKFLAPSHG